MKYGTTKYTLEVDTQIDDGAILNTTMLMTGLEKAVTGVKKQLLDTFSTGAKEADGFNQSLSRSIKTLQADTQEMKAAFTQAAEPIGRVLIPALDQVVQKATVVAQSVAIVLSTLMGMDTATKMVKETTKAEERLKKASVSAASAAKRSLAGFDQINRLGSPGGGSGGVADAGSVSLLPETVNDTLSPQVQAMVNKIMKLLEPVLKIDFTPLKNSLQALGQALSGLGSIISQSLAWVWFEVLVPLGTWIIQEAAPATVNVLTAAFQALSAALAPVLLGIQNVKTYLEPVVQFIGETVLLTLEALQQQFSKVAQVFGEKGVDIQATFQGIGQVVSVLWAQIQPVLERIRSLWLGVIESLGSSISGLVRVVTEVLGGLTTFIAGVLSGNWQQAWDGLRKIFVGFVNGVIGAVNGLIRGVVNGINSIIRALNQVKFTLPDWDVLGKLAGKSYGINLNTISAPQIPYLAKGAVLPANRPFLAMVGDQKHGTNVEAPLATIQEAVALVMDDMIASNMAGQEMIVGVLRELLEAVMGIRVGDEVIGRAVQRYNRKMAVVKGGYV